LFATGYTLGAIKEDRNVARHRYFAKAMCLVFSIQIYILVA